MGKYSTNIRKRLSDRPWAPIYYKALEVGGRPFMGSLIFGEDPGEDFTKGWLLCLKCGERVERGMLNVVTHKCPPDNLKYYMDNQRHLICVPYSVENLHKMAQDLGIKKHWFHSKGIRSHYDIPKTMSVPAVLVTTRTLLGIMTQTSKLSI